MNPMEQPGEGEQPPQQQPWGRLLRLGVGEGEPHVLLRKREWTIGRRRGAGRGAGMRAGAGGPGAGLRAGTGGQGSGVEGGGRGTGEREAGMRPGAGGNRGRGPRTGARAGDEGRGLGNRAGAQGSGAGPGDTLGGRRPLGGARCALQFFRWNRLSCESCSLFTYWSAGSLLSASCRLSNRRYNFMK